jgi:hypothetical protein
MGRILVEQPNGKWAVWSTVVDDFILLDCDEPDLFAMEVRDSARTWATDTERRVRRNSGGNSPKYWIECLETRRAIHGHEQDFRDDPFDGAVSATPVSNWNDFFALKLAELCGAYYKRLMEIRDGKVVDPPEGMWDLRAHYEELLEQLMGKKP